MIWRDVKTWERHQAAYKIYVAVITLSCHKKVILNKSVKSIWKILGAIGKGNETYLEIAKRASVPRLFRKPVSVWSVTLFQIPSPGKPNDSNSVGYRLGSQSIKVSNNSLQASSFSGKESMTVLP
jgi:hypothetical protein